MKACGFMEMPAPAPPANTSFGTLAGISEPPETKPNETFEIGMIVEPSGEVIGLPMIVFTSTRSRIFSIDVFISPSRCCAITVILS